VTVVGGLSTKASRLGSGQVARTSCTSAYCARRCRSRIFKSPLNDDDLPVETARKRQSHMYKTACARSSCQKCGLKNYFSLLNMAATQGDGKGDNPILHSALKISSSQCPIENTDDTRTWRTWAAMHIGISKKTEKHMFRADSSAKQAHTS